MDRKNLVKVPDQVPPTLETLPRELQLQICREMLRSDEPIMLCPCEDYVSGFAFGSLGILRVSKYFSTMALSVMYGENCFRLLTAEFTIENKRPKNNAPKKDNPKDDGLLEDDDLVDSDTEDSDLEDDEQYTVDIETLRHGPWENLKNIPDTLFGKVVSSVDCLDMISQTSSGQKFMKHLQIDLGAVAWIRVMDGVLLRILRRLRGLHSVKLNFCADWQDHTRDWSGRNHLNWEKENARDFLLLIKRELSHIKKITMDWALFESDDPAISCWIADELEKRNKAWAPPLPSYKNFRLTLSPVSVVDARVARSVVAFNDDYRIRGRRHGLDDSKNPHGVF